MYSQEILVASCGADVTSPIVSQDGQLFVVLGNSGNIMRVRDDRLFRSYSTASILSAAAFDSVRGILYAADMAQAAILGLRDKSQDVLVDEYEDKPLRGPHSLACSRDGKIVFTDSGPLGATGLHAPKGSLFLITNGSSGQHILKPISYETLAYPTGIAFSPNERFIYVAEMCMNRVLRYFQSPEGVYHASVFYQFSGGVGPSALACDNQGNIFVAHYEQKDVSQEGKISIISSSGKLVDTILIPGAEISGICVR